MVCRSTFVLDRPDDDDEASPPLDDDDDTVSDAFVAVLILLSFETTSSSSSARRSAISNLPLEILSLRGRSSRGSRVPRVKRQGVYARGISGAGRLLSKLLFVVRALIADAS